MKFGTITVHNFMSVENASIRLNDLGLVLIKGENNDSQAFKSNGAGKSTLYCESLCWGLFGITIRGLKADDVVNKRAKKNTCVCVDITDDNGDTFIIKRYRKHKEHKNNVMLFHGSENITCKSDKDTDAKISELIQMDYLTFTNSVLFGQGITKTFAGATDGDQKKILEQLLGIDIFRECQEVAKSHYTQLHTEVAQIERDQEGNLNQKRALEKEIEDLQQREAEQETRIDNKIQELTTEMEVTQDFYDNLPDVTGLDNDKRELLELVSELDEQLKSFEVYENSQKDLRVELGTLQRAIQLVEHDISNKEEQLADIRSGKNIPKSCETCGQPLPSKDTSHIENHLEETILKNRQVLTNYLEDKNEVEGLLARVNKQLENRKPLQQRKDNRQKQISDLSIEINRINYNETLYLNAIMSCSKQIEEQEAQRGTTYTELINNKILGAQELDEVISCNNEVLEEKKDLMDKYNFWVTGFGNQGVKSLLLDSVTPFLNQRVNYYLSKLADSTIEVTFNTQTELKSGDKRDKFSVEVSNENGGEKYSANSGGEKKRIDVAVNMALQDLAQSRSNKRMDIIVYDECFESLDETGCEAVIELLQEKAKACGTVVVITHNEQLQQLFTKSIVVGKELGSTTIREE